MIIQLWIISLDSLSKKCITVVFSLLLRSFVKTIQKFIHYYNHKRIKEKLGWKSPVEFRLSQ